MVGIYGTTLAASGEIARCNVVRRLVSLRFVVGIGKVEDDTIRLLLVDGSTMTQGKPGLVEVAR